MVCVMDGNCSCAPLAVKDDDVGCLAFGIIRSCYAPHMKLLKKANDQISLQILCDLLESGGISYRVEGAGMNSLMPLPGLIEARVLVHEQDMKEAEAILIEIEKEEDRDHV